MVPNTENDLAPNISGAKAEKTCVSRNRPADKKENKKQKTQKKSNLQLKKSYPSLSPHTQQRKAQTN